MLCRKVEIASSPGAKARGLMFRSRLEGGMLFPMEKEKTLDIWMFGMRFAIDIVWIDSSGRIVKVKENAKPWRFLGWAKAKNVLELPAGTLRKTGTKKGDLLKVDL